MALAGSSIGLRGAALLLVSPLVILVVFYGAWRASDEQCEASVLSSRSWRKLV